ncbi:disease resistance protein RUN1-like isoform X2 [Apium graveolens]|uniref:disease resistance protein RUN1-like isoform X2 n=1 Tax=Apium graveolens TaxID=4045 RepID=UPI003D7BDC9A
MPSSVKEHCPFLSPMGTTENYACSPWCLDELAEILSSNRTKNQVVPIFCYVNPSDVRHQQGSFGKALDGHKKRYPVDMIEKWKSALSEIAALSGHHLRQEAKENESDTIQEIVGNVVTRASTTVSHLKKYLYGINSAVEEIYHKLSMESNDVRVIGICGMGGIGKTTIAKAFYDNYFNKFDISCFNENINQYSQEGSPSFPLLKQLLIELLGKKDCKVTGVERRIRKLRKILHSKKALVILDDLNQSNYSELLLANLSDLFSAGSRIIITTRDANLLNKMKMDISVDIYVVKTLKKIDSLELFCYHAFRKPVPPEKFRELSLNFVTYAGGLPLAIKVLGSSLVGRTYEFWKAKLEKVEEIPENDIYKVLKMSYDELDDETEKAIFLDIAFFFVGKDKDEAVHVFKSCGFFPDVGIPILVDRCLLTIGTNNKFEMHNLIQEMGRELGKSKSTHLFLRGNARKDLRNLEERNDIEGLVLDFTTSKYGQVTTFLFERMPNLRLLQIIDAPDIKGNFKKIFPNLRCIRWHSCPWTHIPSTFLPPNIVSLDMPSSKFKILWKGPKPIKHLNNLRYLYLRACRDLKRLPKQLGDMKALKKIDASYTAIEKLPDSITHLKQLDELNLVCCEKLSKLPEEIGNMKGLKMLDVGSSAIEQLPDSFGGLINLGRLHLSNCQKLRNLPNNIWKLKLLKGLYLSKCSNLEQLPEQLGKMQCLEELYACDTAIERVPDSIGLLGRLKGLDFTDCKKLKFVAKSIWNLNSIEYLYLHPGDTAKISLPDSVKNMKKLKTLNLSCNVGLCLPMIQCFSSLESLTLTDEGQIPSSAKPFSLSKLINLQHLKLYNCTNLGSSLPELPLNLEELRVYNQNALEQLPDLSSLRKLKELCIWRCVSLQSISLLPSHLQSLLVHECTSLQDLPDMSMLKELVKLSFTGCNNLKSISLKQSSLEIQSYFPFSADLPNREVAEWFNYKSTGHTVCFDVPPSFGSNFLGLALWVVYTCNAKEIWTYVSAVITNETEGITENHPIYLQTVVGEAQSSIQCIRGKKLSMKSGDTVKVFISSLLYSGYKVDMGASIGKVKVKMFGVHLVQNRLSTSVYQLK